MEIESTEHQESEADLLQDLLMDLPEQDYQRFLSTFDKESLDLIKKELISRDARWSTAWPLFMSTLNVRQHAKSYFEQGKDNAWSAIEGRLVRPRVIQRGMRGIFWIAASILLIGLFSLWGLNRYYAKDRFTQNYSYLKEWHTGDQASMSITLPDSTQVWLNANSRISYIKGDNEDVRQVKLSGEAYFEVNSSPERPFYVHLSEGTVMVTGTHFFAGQSDLTKQVYVDLREGHVDFMPYGFAKDKIAVEPSFTLWLQGKETELSRENKHDYSWLRKPIDMTAVPLKDLAKQLEVWYGVSIRLDQNIADMPFSGMIDPAQTLASQFEKIQWTSNLEVSGMEGTYSIHLK